MVHIYLHKFVLSDEDRALHDHPWPNASILIAGTYDECVQRGDKDVGWFRRKEGFVYFRKPSTAHRIALMEFVRDKGKELAIRKSPLLPISTHQEIIYAPVITLFITGPKIRNWGFWCPKGWRRWEDFCDSRDHGVIGRGCE